MARKKYKKGKKAFKMGVLDFGALWLMIIGSVAWGIIGVAKWNFVEWLLGKVPFLESLVYFLVGVSGLYWAGLSIYLWLASKR